MKTYSVVFAPEAEDDLIELYEYIAEHGSPTIAARYTEAIVAYCEGLATIAHRGTRRDDMRPELRITNYKHSAVIGPAKRDRTAEESTMSTSHIQRAIRVHSVRLLGKMKKNCWKRVSRKASIHAG